MNLATKINEYVEANQIPKNILARKSGMSENALSLCLNGKRRLLADEYIKLCDAMCVGYEKFAPSALSDSPGKVKM